MVFRRALHLLKSHADAQEATQEVFMRALKQKRPWHEISEKARWLHRITTRLCINRLRDVDRRRSLWKEHLGDLQCELAPLHNSVSETRLLLQKILDSTPPLEMNAALRVFVHGQTHREAAHEMKVSRKTVGNLLDRIQGRTLALRDQR